MLSSQLLPVVSPAFPVLDGVRDSTSVLDPFVTRESSALQKQTASRHGHHILLLVRFEQNCQPLYLQPFRCSLCYWRIYCWLAGEHLFEKDGRYCIHVNGDWCSVFGSRKYLPWASFVDTDINYYEQSGLSQAGGITANGNGIDIGGAMIAVTIGITVGLFMSQALVYTFGSRKNAAVFSF